MATSDCSDARSDFSDALSDFSEFAVDSSAPTRVFSAFTCFVSFVTRGSFAAVVPCAIGTVTAIAATATSSSTYFACTIVTLPYLDA